MVENMVASVNRVTLIGRVTSQPERKELPSGTTIVSFRVVMARETTAMTSSSRQSSDWVDCVAWSKRVQRTVASWVSGDIVELEGSVRRRFFRSGAGPASRVEVEVLGARRVSRA